MGVQFVYALEFVKQRTGLVEISVSRLRILHELCSSVLEKCY